ncbi:arginyl-tRNA--protein transferase 1 [Hyposmocoma kahamanoa]|uniref:arginyl-tRNA--protein transferase 1 n=1 Tax=Hyposmocoma kahamanoa TaxID=1477025 RepID=UPI000E6D79D3|nr:arginyl-tRNA--protein transferase 1 [Hyposmocoma kahamanoa]
MPHSIVEYYAEHESYRCGYCKSPDTNFSHGLWAHAMSVGDYQDLIDRGWRRSGKYCYKPTMDVTCCPMYTIRCRAQEFKSSKSQKKVLKRFNKFLSGEEINENRVGDPSRSRSACSSEVEGELFEEGRCEQFVETNRGHKNINLDSITRTNVEESSSNIEEKPNGSNDNSSGMEVSQADNSSETNVQKDFKKITELDPTKSPCKKAKQLRRERKFEKLKEKGVDITTLSNTNKNKEKQLEDFLNELPKEYQQRLEIKLVRTAPPSPEWLATAKETHEIYVKYQTVIHDDKPEKCTEHKFREFLVHSPLLEIHSETGPMCGYGSFHQQYVLDGKIIAVGVIDILPKCVSSVYFFYDPQYRNLTLGTYGALREIAFTRHLSQICPELKYYYMGFYIHSCRKMRYKGNFYPSDLLCPETYKWVPLEDCIPKLEASPYTRLDPDIDNVDTNYPREGDINYIPVLVKGVVLPYKAYKRKYANKKRENDEELMEYARLVGAKTIKSLILVR